MIPMIIINGIFEATGKRFWVKVKPEGKYLLSIFREQNIYADAPCGGKGSCGRCRVRFLKGAPEPVYEEQILFAEEELKSGWRLACKTVPVRDSMVLIPDLGRGEIQVQTEFCPGDTYSREVECKRGKNGTDRNTSFGIAVDIGTTTIAMALIDLNTGEQKSVLTSVNRQRMYGADVISRIKASNDGHGERLKICIRSDLKRMFHELSDTSGIAFDQIVKIAVAGNTTMLHLLLGYSCETLGQAPFTPVNLSLLTASYEEIFGEEVPAEVTLLPGISAFVGADITAGIYSSGMAEREEISMFLDIGTNGEMAVGNRDGILVASVAAGPAFEGGNISCGMPGVPGAIAHVMLPDRSGKDLSQISYETIGHQKPIGLCGTGIIDITYELVQKQFADAAGTLLEPWFTENFPIAGMKVYFSQNDIREVQMAKAAIRAGIEILQKEYGISPDELANVYLAGGFGFSVDVEKAAGIGMFPPSFPGRVLPLGNSALEGARRYLLEKDAGTKMERIVGSAKERKLALHPEFYELYMKYMFFE